MFQAGKRRSAVKFVLLGVLFVYGIGWLIGIISLILITDFASQFPEEFLYLLAYFVCLLAIMAAFLLWRSFAVHHWQLYAFAKVEESDWVRLFKSGMKWGLFPGKDDYSIRLYRLNAEGRQRVSKISERLAELQEIDQVYFDFSTADEQSFRLKRDDQVFFVIVLSLSVIVLLTSGNNRYWAVIGGVALIAIANIVWRPKRWQYALSGKPVMVLNESGIAIDYPRESFFAWASIECWEVSREKKQLLLKLEGHKEVTLISLHPFHITDHYEFFQYLKVYWDRYEQQFLD